MLVFGTAGHAVPQGMDFMDFPQENLVYRRTLMVFSTPTLGLEAQATETASEFHLDDYVYMDQDESSLEDEEGAETYLNSVDIATVTEFDNLVSIEEIIRAAKERAEELTNEIQGNPYLLDALMDRLRIMLEVNNPNPQEFMVNPITLNPVVGPTQFGRDVRDIVAERSTEADPDSDLDSDQESDQDGDEYGANQLVVQDVEGQVKDEPDAAQEPTHRRCPVENCTEIVPDCQENQPIQFLSDHRGRFIADAYGNFVDTCHCHLVRHLKDHAIKKQQDARNRRSLYTCPLPQCNRSFTSLSNLPTHLQQHCDTQHFQLPCGQICKDRMAAGNVRDSRPCTVCSKKPGHRNHRLQDSPNGIHPHYNPSPASAHDMNASTRPVNKRKRQEVADTKSESKARRILTKGCNIKEDEKSKKNRREDDYDPKNKQRIC